jgi:RHS repeat-associated protein
MTCPAASGEVHAGEIGFRVLPGQYFDAETGLSYNYFRDYDPSLGRYIESDPIGLMGGINTFSYANLSPIEYRDADGRFGALAWCLAGPEGCIVGAAVAVGGAIWAMSNGDRRSRGKQDPVWGLKPQNPGRDCNGDCNHCPDDELWSAPGNAHGSTDGQHWHWIKWNQRESDCMCFPDRGSGPTPPQGLRLR